MEVAAIQSALNARGFAPGPADGDAGPRTVAALQAFQRGARLVPDGIAGPRTLAALAGAPGPIPADAPSRPGDPPWLALARAEFGTREGAGHADEPRVIAYFRDAGFPGIREDAVAWCAAFVGAMLVRAAQAPSGSLAARSYEGWGTGLAGPRLGCVGVKRRGASSWQGHVGFVVGANAARVVLLGGNQGDRVSVAAFARRDFTAYRWPAGLPPPTSTALPATVAGARIGVGEA